MTPEQESVKSMTSVLLPILYSAVERRVKNNFYLLQTIGTVSQNDRCASQKCSSATVDFYSSAMETREIAPPL
jgi:hypothetical protein